MTNTYGFKSATINLSDDSEDPFVFHIIGKKEDDTEALIATVDDDCPMLAKRILAMLRLSGIMIESADPLISDREPAIHFIGVRGSVDEEERNWTDLEVRFLNNEKKAAATFPEEYEEFAFAMAELFPRP